MWVCLATVTEPSLIASSSADCVFGVARLISSASTMFAKIGPRWNSKRLPPPGSSTMTLVPTMSAGIRSGVNWTRENEAWMHSESVRTSIVLPRPGTPSRRAWPPPRRHMRTPSMISSWPTIILLISSRRRRRSAVNSETDASTSRGATAVAVLIGCSLSSVHRVRLDLREVLLDVVLVARRDLLAAHHLFDDALVVLVDLLV